LIMVGWSVLQSRISRSANTVNFSSSPLVEGLQVESVSAVTVAGDKGTQSVHLEKKDGVFLVTDKDNYLRM